MTSDGGDETVSDQATRSPQVVVSGRRPDGRWLELGVLAAIFGVAIFLRLEHLSTIPYGVSGDEAVSGLETRRVLHEGWIGLYSPLAAGQPTGVFYVMSMAVRVFGDSIFALRLVSAVAGVLSVGVLYALVRRNLGAGVAMVACALFAVSGWDLHFSRYAVPLGTWPLVVLLVMGSTVEALQTCRLRWWVSLGVFAGIGVYVYDAHLFFVALVSGFVVVTAIRDPAPLGRKRRPLLAGLVAAAVTVLPMGINAVNNPDAYLSHLRASSIFGHASWTSLESFSEQFRFLVGRYFGYWDHLCCHTDVDGIDGTGVVPLLPWAMALLAVLGIGLALWRLRHATDTRARLLLGLAVWITVLAPIASVISEGGEMRRTVPALPALCIFAALVVVEVGKWAGRTSATTPRLVAGALSIVVVLGVYQSSNVYRSFVGSDAEAAVFYRDLSAASRFMNGLSDSDYVYFLYERTSIGYESRLYLAPNVRGEDRSLEFATFDLRTDESDGDPVFMLLGRYIENLDDLQDMYPDGETIVGEGTPAPFVAYIPPR